MHPAHPVCHPVQVPGAVSIFLCQLPGLGLSVSPCAPPQSPGQGLVLSEAAEEGTHWWNSRAGPFYMFQGPFSVVSPLVLGTIQEAPPHPQQACVGLLCAHLRLSSLLHVQGWTVRLGPGRWLWAPS